MQYNTIQHGSCIVCLTASLFHSVSMSHNSRCSACVASLQHAKIVTPLDSNNKHRLFEDENDSVYQLHSLAGVFEASSRKISSSSNNA